MSGMVIYFLMAHLVLGVERYLVSGPRINHEGAPQGAALQSALGEDHHVSLAICRDLYPELAAIGVKPLNDVFTCSHSYRYLSPNASRMALFDFGLIDRPRSA